jgi:hypothetical protein
MLNRLFRTTVQCERHCQITMRSRKIWIEVERALKFVDRLISSAPRECHIGAKADIGALDSMSMTLNLSKNL